jgi:leukotriene-A4 hydrolase
LQGVDPDEAFSLVPYEKGYFFLKTLEQAAGRARFDKLLTTWLSEHRFGSAATQDFTALVDRLEPGLLDKVDAKAWIDGPLLPDARWRPFSERLEAVRHLAGTVPTAEQAKGWSPTEWQLFLEATPRPLPLGTCRALDERFSLTAAKNPEVLVAWLTLACESGDRTVLARTEETLSKFGRMKYLKPLFRALVGRPETKALARKVFEAQKPRYHPIAQQVIAGVLKSANA